MVLQRASSLRTPVGQRPPASATVTIVVQRVTYYQQNGAVMNATDIVQTKQTTVSSTLLTTAYATNWMVTLDPVAVSSATSPAQVIYIVTVTATLGGSSSKLVFKNVLFGDVVFVSGQSNAERNLIQDWNATAVIRESPRFADLIRFYNAEPRLLQQSMAQAEQRLLHKPRLSLRHWLFLCTHPRHHPQPPPCLLVCLSSLLAGRCIDFFMSPQAVALCPQLRALRQHPACTMRGIGSLSTPSQPTPCCGTKERHR